MNPGGGRRTGIGIPGLDFPEQATRMPWVRSSPGQALEFILAVARILMVARSDDYSLAPAPEDIEGVPDRFRDILFVYLSEYKKARRLMPSRLPGWEEPTPMGLSAVRAELSAVANEVDRAAQNPELLEDRLVAVVRLKEAASDLVKHGRETGARLLHKAALILFSSVRLAKAEELTVEQLKVLSSVARSVAKGVESAEELRRISAKLRRAGLDWIDLSE